MRVEEVSAAITQHVDQMALSREPFEVRGIFHSEMAAILGLVKSMSIDLVIESGRARGQSTYILGKYLPGVRIVSIEFKRDGDAEFAEQRLASLSNVELVYGDSAQVVPDIVKRNSSSRIAVLIDGPKGKQALELMRDCFHISDDVKISFVHDLSKDNRSRYDVPDYSSGAFFTDDAEFVRLFKHLDGKVFSETGHWTAPHRNKNKKRKSYGPTLGIFRPGNEPRSGPTARISRSLRRFLRIA